MLKAHRLFYHSTLSLRVIKKKVTRPRWTPSGLIMMKVRSRVDISASSFLGLGVPPPVLDIRRGDFAGAETTSFCARTLREAQRVSTSSPEEADFDVCLPPHPRFG